MKTTLHQLLGAALLLLVALGVSQSAPAQGDRIVFYGPVTETYGKGRSATTETHNQILTMNSDGSDVRQLTAGREDCFFPSWSPNRSHILFHRGGTIGNGGEIYVMDSNGNNQFRVAAADQCGADWSPDGAAVCYVGYPSSSPGPRGLWAVSVNPNAKGKNPKVGTPVLLAEGHFYAPTWSPDGTRIAYHSPASGRIAVLDLATGVASWLESIGGILPSWSPTGDRIAFSSNDNTTYSQLHIMNADFTNIRQVTDLADARVYWSSWSADGAEVVLRASLVDVQGWEGASLYKLNLASGELTWLADQADHPDWTP